MVEKEKYGKGERIFYSILLFLVCIVALIVLYGFFDLIQDIISVILGFVVGFLLARFSK
jgi:hypothetical protein